jgi:tetratricopeptide (TPR) repeat protein
MAVRSSSIQVGLGLLILLGSLPAWAGQKEDAARAEVAAGTAAYNLGYYDDAARHYEEAYRQVPDPALLFNVGQAYRLAGKPDRAITAYRSYLRTAPADAANRAQVEKRIPELEKLLAEMKSAQTAPPGGTLPTAPPAVTPPAVQSPGSVPAVPPAAPPVETQGSALPATASPAAAEPAGPGTSDFPTFGTPPAPSPASPAAQPSADVPPGADLHAATPAPASESTPVYKTWWFWTGVGVVAVASVVIAAVVLSSGSSKGIPSTKLGNQPIFH